MPKPSLMSRPVSAFHFAEVLPRMAEPPPPAMRSPLKSTSLIRGCISSPTNKVFTPVITVQRAFDSTPTKPSMSRASGTSQFCAPSEK